MILNFSPRIIILYTYIMIYYSGHSLCVHDCNPRGAFCPSVSAGLKRDENKIRNKDIKTPKTKIGTERRAAPSAFFRRIPRLCGDANNILLLLLYVFPSKDLIYTHESYTRFVTIAYFNARTRETTTMTNERVVLFYIIIFILF